LHETDSIEAVNSRVEEKTQGVVGQAVEAKKEGDEGDKNEG
jgi:hypothetical protein